MAKTNIIVCIWCNSVCLCGLRFKIHITFHISCINFAPLCPAFLKLVDFYKAHRSEKQGVLWLASYSVHCDWPNTSSMLWKCSKEYWQLIMSDLQSHFLETAFVHSQVLIHCTHSSLGVVRFWHHWSVIVSSVGRPNKVVLLSQWNMRHASGHSTTAGIVTDSF